MTIRRQMILVLAAVTLLPLLVAAFVLQNLSSRRLFHDANNTLLARTRAVASEVDATLQRNLDHVRRGAQFPALRDFLLASDRASRREATLGWLSSAVFDDAETVQSCALLDLAGALLLDTAASAAPSRENDLPVFQTVLQTRRPAVAMVKEKDTSVLWFGAPIQDATGQVVGVLRLRCRAEVLARSVSRPPSLPKTEVLGTVLDERGRVVLQNAGLTPATERILTDEVLGRGGAAEGAFAFWSRWSQVAQSTGQDDRVALVSLKALPWRVALVQPGTQFFAHTTELRQLLAVFVAIVIGLSAAAVLLIAHRLSQPVVAMATAVQRVADGQLATVVPERGPGEFTTMARAFNHMTDRLRGTLGTLEQHVADLEASETRLRELIDASPVGIAITNERLEIVQLNRKFTELFGYTTAETPTLAAWWERAYPDPSYREKVKQDWQGVVAEARGRSAASRPVEATVTCLDGTRRDVEFRWKLTSRGERLTVVTDLTERRQAEHALHTSEERHRLLLDHAPEAIVVFDTAEGHFVDCNPAAESFFKLPRAELLHRSHLDFSPTLQPDGRPSAELAGSHVAEALAGRIQVFEWVHRDVLGREIPCEIRLMRLPDAANRQLVRGSIVDISARKQAQDTLRESEERFRLLVENSTELVAQINSQGTYLYASPNHLAVTGYDPELLVGTSVFNYIHPDDLPRVREALQDDQAVRQFRFRYQDGRWHWLESAGRRFHTSSGVEMGAVISRDVTARVEAEETRKRLESQLRQSQKMEAVGTLAGGIAHDFNNILTGILGNTQLAEHELPPGHPARSLLGAAIKASLRARDLVAKILTFSRHREQPQQAVHTLGPLVQEALGLLRASLPATIQIREEIARTPLPVICDPVQIHQIVMNLGTNAAHAMQPRGGMLTVTLGSGTPPAALREIYPKIPSGQFACLTVRDTGSGMDAETRDRIFEPFFTTKPVGEGTGLGLAVVHGIVEDHQGAISVESTPGAGTTFQIWLPSVGAETSAGGGAMPGPPRGQGQRILFVDDEPTVGEIAVRILNSLGYRAESYASPVAAWEQFNRAPDAYAALVSDLTMPELSGSELIRRMLDKRPGLPVLVITGYMRSGEVERVRALGVRHFMPKPFSLQSLAEQLHQALTLR